MRMANLRTAMDATIGDLNIASTKNLDGRAKAVPGETFPLDGSVASRALRVQQLSLLGNGFPLGIIPSLSPSSKEVGSFSLQSLLLQPSVAGWWIGLMGQFRPQKLISGIKAEIFGSDEWELPAVKDVAKHVLDKSLYSLGLSSHIPVTESSSILLHSEMHGDRKERRNKIMLRQNLPDHDVMLEAAWPQLFVDKCGRYWDVPESISLDIASLTSESGFKYQVGLRKNSGFPRDVDASNANMPPTLMPGLCAKAGVSYEGSKDFWREKETKEDLILETEKGQFLRPAYDVRLKEPHATVSATIGGTCGAWFGRQNTSLGQGADNPSHSAKKINPFFADLFGSLCYTYQHGKFRKPFGDLTRIDARLDVSSASAFAKSVSHVFSRSSNNRHEICSSLPKLSVILQQQISGPIVFRIDTRCALNSSRGGVQIEDFMCSLSYSLRLLQSGKVVAWYSPKRKEGMIELRLFEF